MNILLLAVPGGSLERDRKGSTVELDFSSDDSLTLPSSQDIHQSRLSSTRRTHESGQSSSLAVSEDVVKELLILSVGFDCVVQVLPGESTARQLWSSNVNSRFSLCLHTIGTLLIDH